MRRAPDGIRESDHHQRIFMADIANKIRVQLCLGENTTVKLENFNTFPEWHSTVKNGSMKTNTIFVASDNYRGTGRRFDTVEVSYLVGVDEGDAPAAQGTATDAVAAVAAAAATTAAGAAVVVAAAAAIGGSSESAQAATAATAAHATTVAAATAAATAPAATAAAGASGGSGGGDGGNTAAAGDRCVGTVEEEDESTDDQDGGEVPDGVSDDEDDEVDQVEREEWAVQVLCYFSDRGIIRNPEAAQDVGRPVKGYAVVRFFESIGVDSELGVVALQLINSRDMDGYEVVPIKSITAHAHLVPDFENPGVVFWDKVQDGRLNSDENRVRGELVADWNIRRAKNALDRATAAVSAAAADIAGMATMLQSHQGGLLSVLEVT